MPARTQNVSQHVLANPFPRKRGHNMHFKMCCPNPSHVSTDTKCIWICVDLTHPKPAINQNASQHVLNKPITYNRGYKIHHNLCSPYPARTQHASQHGLTKIIPCQRGRQMHLYMCRPNPSHASEDTKCFSTCVHKNHPMPPKTQNTSQHVLTKSLPLQRGHKINLNMCWTKLSHAR